jgi:hypothetical protein
VNRRALLAAFLAAPAAVKLGRWKRPAPFDIVDGMVIVRPGQSIQAALDYVNSQGGGFVFLAPGHHEVPFPLFQVPRQLAG